MLKKPRNVGIGAEILSVLDERPMTAAEVTAALNAKRPPEAQLTIKHVRPRLTGLLKQKRVTKGAQMKPDGAKKSSVLWEAIG